MRIVHICLAASYVEGFGYQENILPQFHANMGNEVTILTSNRIFNSKYERMTRDKTDYVNEFGIHVITLSRSSRYGYYSRFGDYDGIIEQLTAISPDVIFVHGGQFVALKDVILYCKRNKNVRLFIDQHGDYYNMSISSWKPWIVQKFIYAYWMRKAERYCQRFWGVTPWRCQYLREVYGISEKKIGLLVMGGDDRYIHFDQKPKIRADIRKKLDIAEADFVVITGGKIDATKNIHKLMQAVNELNNPVLKLIVFGQPSEEMHPVIQELSDNACIRNIGWIDSTQVYDYYLASDLAVFPGTHSVLWEQACACKVPCLVKRWEGMEHVNNGGNCGFLDDVSVDGLKKAIQELVFTEKYDRMLEVAQSDATDIFLYSKIAEKSLECKLTDKK